MARAKSSHNKYGERDSQINAKLSEKAKQGLQALAKVQGVSLNEFLELLGRGEVQLSPEMSLGK